MKKQPQENPSILMLILATLCYVIFTWLPSLPEHNTNPVNEPEVLVMKPESGGSVDDSAGGEKPEIIGNDIGGGNSPAPTYSIVLVSTEGCAPCEQLAKRLEQLDGYECYVVKSGSPEAQALFPGKTFNEFPYVALYKAFDPLAENATPIAGGVITPAELDSFLERNRK